MTIHVDVFGIVPAPQGSKRHVGGGRMIEASRRVKPWREAVRQAALDLNEPVITTACSVSMVFRFPRPKNHFRSNGELKETAPGWLVVKRNDLDKLCRSTLDGLSHSVKQGRSLLADDCLVVAIAAEKRYCIGEEAPGACITVIPINY